MSKKPEAPTGEENGRRQLMVLNSAGVRRRFLRGMITHDLVQRGLDFDDAYDVAQAIRDRLSDREEITTAQIRVLIQEHLQRLFGEEIPAGLRKPARPVSEIRIGYPDHQQPFSRGLLARSLHAAGVDLDRAYRLVTELEGELRSENAKSLPSGQLARRVGNLVEQYEGEGAARRYRLMRRIRRLPRPLVIYIGGASGTGKSTLALELAPLLHIYRINATDTIRQVMRMVFTPSILPALHTSSFEVAGPWEPGTVEDRSGSPRDPDYAHRLTASFEEQAARVGVGIRAVVERAISENLSIVVEGVHVHPGLVPFADLEGAAYQVPLFLATLDEEAHRARFLAQSRTAARRAERHLENFASIRFLHDYLLQQAENFDRPLLDTSEGDSVAASLRLVTGVLEKSLPAQESATWLEAQQPSPVLLVIIDGLADRPVRALGGRTPLQAANTPTLDRLAREGSCGLADPIAPGVVPDTAAGSLAVLGQSPLALKRGPVEAMGAGFQLATGDVALRGNLATLDEEGRVIDRRAGRIREGANRLAEVLDRLHLPVGTSNEVDIRVKVSTEHRLAIVLRGEGLTSAIQGSDPGETATPGLPQAPRPIDPDDEKAAYTAGVLALFEQEARRVLADHPINRERRRQSLPPANAVLTRGAGHIHRLLPLEEAGLPLRLACISGDRTVLGLAQWLGAETHTRNEWTANLDTDIEAKFEVARAALQRSDLVLLHLKGADIAAHDRRPDLKADFLERVDQQLGQLLEALEEPLRVAVASDHATLSESGQHAADPLPVLIWGAGVNADDVQTFDETAAAGGALRRFPLQLLLSRLFKLE